uniref:ATP-dependent RNA helicase FANCM n=1 Tax=Lepisosteus oculatus TaxID=7918 RepID=W5MZV3_LEPOC|nr:PREDICTED: Fanconi anemia group M protein [Lepisosteus oculatus]
MSSGKQRTLFQTWGSTVQQNPDHPDLTARGKRPSGRRKAGTSNAAGKLKPKTSQNPPAPRGSLWGQIGQAAPAAGCWNGDEDDDDLMLVAVYEAEKSLESLQSASERDDGGAEPGITAGSEDLPGFDRTSADIWIYPTNYPVREYQLKISETALSQNTLVCLPTGLGKTFIAAVVMYNFYRWYPSSKIVFMAPTKPLVAQQIEACYKVMGIPQDHMAELTGSTQAQTRKEIWRSRRVFFLTPQVMVNDLSREACPASQVKCVVIDEAHKALGNHAYCQVVRELWNHTQQFRVLALSATPGSDARAVQQVISNLLISHIELRSEESPDIQPYSHQRSLEKVVVPLGEELARYQARYLLVLEKFTSRLTQLNVLSQRDIRNLTKYQLILARDQFRNIPPSHIGVAQQGVLEGDFALCISLYHGYELLLQMGLRSLFLFVQGIMDGSKEMPRARNELLRNQDFMELYQEMEAKFLKPSMAPPAGPEEPFLYSHPKLRKLEEVVLEHFRSWSEHTGPGDAEGAADRVCTRVMIFSSFRESVQEIAAMLSRHQPLVRVMTFMGQSSAGKGVRGFTQKEQLEVVRRFRGGGFNTLVSTCVGEEGLDIGEVDLIVCFDAQKSPIRLVQRMGRTGRRRQGRIVVILAEGREERTYNQSQSNKRSIYKSIMGSKQSFRMYTQSPRLLPEGVRPSLHKMFITSGQFQHRQTSCRASRGRRSDALIQESFTHPRGPGCPASRAKDGGLLSPEELSLWNSSLRLEEEEPQPTLPRSHFLSLKSEPPSPECVPTSSSRELSLWEWRCWQNRLFPTAMVDHSDRCRHFSQIMELIDCMRQEEKGECNYELELMPYLKKEDVIVCKGNKASCGETAVKGKRPRRLGSNLHPVHSKKKRSSSSSIDMEEVDRDFRTPGVSVSKQTSSVCMPESTEKCLSSEDAQAINEPKGCGMESEPSETFQAGDIESECIIIPDKRKDPGAGSADHCSSPELEALHQSAKLSPHIGYANKTDESCSDIEAMFYFPKCTTFSFEKCPDKEIPHNVKVILANVKELLERSPPPEPDLDFDLINVEPPLDSKSQPINTFQITFSLTGELEVPCGEKESSDIVLSGSDLKLNGVASHGVMTKEAAEVNKRPTGHAVLKACSPSWDVIFDEVPEENPTHDEQDMGCRNSKLQLQAGTPGDGNDKATGKQYCQSHSFKADPKDESMDLFEDDDLFLQVSVPDPVVSDDKSPRPNAPAGPVGETDGFERDGLACRDLTVQEKTAFVAEGPTAPYPSSVADQQQLPQDEGQYNCSQELFSVNFDLGFSMEESEDELPEKGNASPHEAKESASSSATPTSERAAETWLIPNEEKHGSSSRCWMDPRGMNCVTPLIHHTERETAPFSVSKGVSVLSPVITNQDQSLLAPPDITDQDQSLLGPPGITNQDRNLLAPTAASTPTPFATLTSPRGSGKLLKRTQTSRPDPSFLGSKLWSPLKGHTQGHLKRALLKAAGPTSENRPSDPLHKGGSSGDSDEEAVFRGHRKRTKANPLDSPDVSDVDSPIQVAQRRRAPFISLEESGDEQLSDQDFKDSLLRRPRRPRPHRNSTPPHGAKVAIRAAREFLDEEAELSEEGGAVSSDEACDSSEELDHSLAGFVVDNIQPSQGLNDSAMHGVYLKSVRSPAVHNKYKMVYKPSYDLEVCSQVTEQDESYMEDSFVVQGGEEEEEEPGDSDEEEVCAVELLPDDTCIGGRKLYPTRRRVRLRRAQGLESGPELFAREVKKPKASRIIVPEDTSEEEEEGKMKDVKEDAGGDAKALPRPGEPPLTRLPVFKTPQPEERGSAIQEERRRQQLSLQASVSEALDFQPASSKELSAAQQQPGCSGVGQGARPPLSQPVCVLADSRGIAGGPEVLSCLRLRHGVTAQVCSLGACDFIVSNRMAVERQTLSEISSSVNRGRLAERVRALQGSFDRVCLIVEKDRTKPGEVSRVFQRSRYYDSTLAALIRAGTRLLFSSGPEDTAALLAELARVEQRKSNAIAVPTEVKGQRHQALQFYLTLPGVSYIAALNMCHRFSSVWHLVNSAVEELAAGACVSRPRAEEIFRCLRYAFHPDLLPHRPAGGAKSSGL